MTTTTFAVGSLNIDTARAEPRKAVVRALVAVSALLHAGHGFFTPAGYFVYAGLLVYAFAQLRPQMQERALVDRLAVPLVLFNVVGMLAEHILVTAALWAVAAVLYRRAAAAVDAGEVGARWRLPFALAFAWLSLALVAPLGAVGLVPALLVTLVVGQRSADPVLPLVVVWGSLVVAIEGASPALPAVVVLLAVAGAIFIAITSRRLLPRHAPSVLLP